MLYGVLFFNQLKGSSNLALFDEEGSAVDLFNTLKDIWDGNIEGIENWDNEDFDIAYIDAFKDIVDILENVDSRKLEETLTDVQYQRNENGKVTTYVDDVQIINLDNPTDVPS